MSKRLKRVVEQLVVEGSWMKYRIAQYSSFVSTATTTCSGCNSFSNSL